MKKLSHSFIDTIRLQAARNWRRINGSHQYGKYKIAKHSIRKRVVITDWNSDKGQERLAKATYKKAFYRIAHHYQAQINPFYCGVACIVAVLNSLRVKNGHIPDDFNYITPDGRKISYHLYSQMNILNEETDLIKKRSEIVPDENGTADNFNPGLTINEVQSILEFYKIQAEVYAACHPNEEGESIFLDKLKEVMESDNKLMMLNYAGSVIGATTGGHYSVVGAYDDISDSVLILDSAAHKNPWYWVPVRHIYHAMNTKGSTGYRGYIVVSER